MQQFSIYVSESTNEEIMLQQSPASAELSEKLADAFDSMYAGISGKQFATIIKYQ